ncbi:nitrate reductase [Flammula alnicola]|nr:nitrate reductase [Flammula alnicola]
MCPIDNSSKDQYQCSSSSSDASESYERSSTPISSIASEGELSQKELEAPDINNQDEIQLPTPFVPPSLCQPTTTELKSRARELPEGLGLPSVPKEDACKVVDPQDVGTPDGWIPRDSRLVRLTGKHPFNSEAKLKDLYAQGFITPSNLFFVRNHGPVPKVSEEMASDWTVRIHGLCTNPVSLTLADLRTKFRVVTTPVTLVCAGNRRKEQNVVQKSLGFSWGAAGVSTALFTGIWLSDLLEYVRPMKGAKHVIFEGCDQLPNGPYGTSQLLSWARDKRKGMMLAWAMNGLPLEPDHGFPLRLVVPSQIGGRSVKWLTRIELSDTESQHYLHFNDNKVLPMPVGPDRARGETGWWHDPRYIIRELNVNSAIACPDHDEILDTSNKSPEETFIMKGYAYAGGGRRITRVEVTLNEGHTWNLAEIQYPEDLYRTVAYSDSVYGTLDLTESDQCFCWSFWSFEVPIATLKKCKSIAVRSMDESLALQPRDMYWNATGMMNNWWFRICIHQLEGGKLQFEHPTSKFMKTSLTSCSLLTVCAVAGTQPGGWMQRVKDEGRDPSMPDFSVKNELSEKVVEKPTPAPISMTKPGNSRKVTLKDLKAHATAEHPWFVVHGEVYDATNYLDEHPGGPDSITLMSGEDATEDFMAIHSSDARKRLAEYHIGTLEEDLIPNKENLKEESSTASFLSPKNWKQVVLQNIKNISKDCKIYRFGLHRPDQELGLSIGQHIYVRMRRKLQRAELVEELVQRAYTPLWNLGDRGFVDVLVKIYYPNEQYPLGGRMTLGFSELRAGDTVELKGPIGQFTWLGDGKALLNGKEKDVRKIGMVCGGSGITPILQVLRGIFHDATDHETSVWVLDFNRHLDDILCRDELDRLAEEYGSRFGLQYSLTGKTIPEGWEYSTGRVNDEMLRTYLPSPSIDGIVCLCGTQQMVQALKASLTRLGWDGDSQVVVF